MVQNRKISNHCLAKIFIYSIEKQTSSSHSKEEKGPYIPSLGVII